jgi:hypothetical protein
VLATLTVVASIAAALPLAGSGAQAATGSASVVVSGTVIASSGRAEPGATVAIHAWPDQAVLSALKIGQKVPWVLVGTGKADASGQYSISLPVTKLAPEESYGVVNLEADTPSAVAFFPVAVTRNSGDAYLPSTHVANLDATPGSPEFPGCAGDGWNYIKNLGKHEATVGETYVLTSHATQQFTYMQGQSSSIEIGSSNSGAAGSFHAVGTQSWSSSLTETWPAYGANRSVWYQTEFNFGEYTCRILGYTFYMDIVNGWAGGATIKKPTSIPSTPSKYCVHQAPGTSAKSNNSHAVTWSAGLGIGTGLRFSASVQTGYDTSAQVRYHFTALRHLCGWKSDPGGTPLQLVVHT